jgi:hypothetical protein
MSKRPAFFYWDEESKKESASFLKKRSKKLLGLKRMWGWVAAIWLVGAAGPAGISVGGPAGATVVSAEALAQLPAITLPVSFGTDHGPLHATFQGPLLWSVLVQEKAVDPAHPTDAVRQTVTVTGSDGYTAILALGEISPEFENKQVILAEQMDGKPLGPDHLRMVVPDDRRGGRSVRDVVRIAVSAPAH